MARQVLGRPLYLQISPPLTLETHLEDLSRSPMMRTKRVQRRLGQYGGTALLRSRQVVFRIMARFHLDSVAQSHRMLLTGVA